MAPPPAEAANPGPRARRACTEPALPLNGRPGRRRTAAEFGTAASPGNGIQVSRPAVEERSAVHEGCDGAKIQGEVHVEAIVLADGTVGATRVVKSLDTQFGLDQSALRSVQLWRFSPGTDSAGTRCR